MTSTTIKIRQEGSSINCYFPLKADGTEMIQIASLRTAVADMHPQLFDAFTAFCTEVTTALLEGVGVQIERTEIQDAPEHERAGHA